MTTYKYVLQLLAERPQGVTVAAMAALISRGDRYTRQLLHQAVDEGLAIRLGTPGAYRFRTRTFITVAALALIELTYE